MPESNTDEWAPALIDPTSVFSDPEEVLLRQGIPHEIKIKILRRWAYDARELSVAEEEGMAAAEEEGMCDGSAELLQRVQAALRDLGSFPEQPHPAPTKEGGL